MPVKFDDCTALHKSEKALLVSIPDVQEDVWIPHDHITDDSEVYDLDQGREGQLIVTDWIAEKKGWI